MPRGSSRKPGSATPRSTRREKLYLDALEALYKDGADDKDRKQNLSLGLETIVQEFPGDIDARAWLAMVTWQNGDRRRRQPAGGRYGDRHGARRPSRCTPAPTITGSISGTGPSRSAPKSRRRSTPRRAPGIAHAWHMPGHTYTGLKRYADAAYQQEGSARVDHAYMIRDRVMPFEIHNYAHNNQWLVHQLSHIGRVRDAIAVARNLVEQPRDPNKNGKNDGGSPQRSGRLRWAESSPATSSGTT